MSLFPGQRLGPYEITAPLGSGGMGEVYRARDAKLDREVAVKVLPARLMEDEEALARFEREAKAVAALSHPSILAIHDFGREGGTAYAVMELLDGETLRQRLASGPQPVRKAVEYAVQMAQALAAAHDKGIVHRDLKPENVFVTRDGRLKVLDFGLAKRDTAARDGSETSSPTAAPPTEPGAVMGTVGYMSPEQVRGQPADARSDIFSLGTVLYEMLSGRRAFARETAAETMTAVLREEPPDLATAVVGLPPTLGRIVEHCLEKRPEERFQSARDLAFDLSSLSDSQVRHERVEDKAPGRRVSPRATCAVLVLLGAILGLVAGRLSKGAGAPPTAKATTSSFAQLTDQPGVEKEPTVSPDGKSVVYAAESGGSLDLFFLRVGGRNPQNLTADSPADDYQPAFSPDGETIAFRSERDGGGVFVMGSTGESVRRLTDFGYNPAWSPDGREVAVASGAFAYPTNRASGNDEISAVDVATGKRRAVTPPDGDFDGMQPAWSPNGRRIAYWGLRGSGGQRDLWTVAADGSEAKTGGLEVTNDAALDWSPAWAPDGRHLYFSSTRGGTMNLWRVPIDEATGRVLGAPEPLTTPSLWSGNPGLTRDGRHLVFASLDWRSTLLRAPFDTVREQLAGPPVPVLRSTLPIRDHDLSPDGQWVTLSSAGAVEDVLVARLDGSPYRRLTDDAFRDRGVSWRPDGAAIAFYSDRGGSYEVWTIRPDGSGLERLVPARGGSRNFPVWSPDGTRMALSSVPGNWSLFQLGPGDPPETEMPAPPGARFWPMSWSSDGQRVAGAVMGEDGIIRGVGFYGLDSRRYEISPRSKRLAWAVPRWLRDGRRLLVRDSQGISIVDTATWREKLLVAVGGYAIGQTVRVGRDDRFITWTETATEGDVWMVSLQ
jgi:serine/threonine protein kinase/Tol biopolymer transport system component